jgi:hypothetical protein
MNLKSIENEANLVNEPNANDLDAASRLGPTINNHLTSLETLCKLMPDCSSALVKIKELRKLFAEKISLQPNVLEAPITMEQQVKHHSQKSVGHLETKLKDMAKTSGSIGYDAIDKVMQNISTTDGVTPDDLHKLFVASHGGMTPDDYAKAVRDKSINEEIAMVYPTLLAEMGNGVWAGLTNHLVAKGYSKLLVEEAVNQAIIRIHSK